jgi:hypothetical protein
MRRWAISGFVRCIAAGGWARCREQRRSRCNATVAAIGGLSADCRAPIPRCSRRFARLNASRGRGDQRLRRCIAASDTGAEGVRCHFM